MTRAGEVRRVPHVSWRVFVRFPDENAPRLAGPLPSSRMAIAEVDDAAAEPVLVDERQIDPQVARQGGGAPTEDHWPDEQGHFVDQPGDESLGGQVRATDQQIHAGRGLQVAYRARVEVAFEPGVRGAGCGQGRGVDDL